MKIDDRNKDKIDPLGKRIGVIEISCAIIWRSTSIIAHVMSRLKLIPLSVETDTFISVIRITGISPAFSKEIEDSENPPKYDIILETNPNNPDEPKISVKLID